MKREGRKEGKECSKREMGDQIVITIHVCLVSHKCVFLLSLKVETAVGGKSMHGVRMCLEH